MADNVGQVLVVSCSSFLSSEDIIREMCKTEFSSPKELSNGSLIAYQWKIENKYYTADVQLCACSVSSLPPQCEFAANMNFQSVIIAFDLREKSSFHNVKSWLPYIETQDPSVLLLLDSGKGNSSKDDFQEKTGIDRVVEALQCAEWPNMKMRGRVLWYL
ncbi:alpha- and gamma-adaptin-binding protein p34-like [Pocillopora damicornis]|nr:alpha- and gamma-adaptin-binding protein p34-like [Pocillopora damicornis]